MAGGSYNREIRTGGLITEELKTRGLKLRDFITGVSYNHRDLIKVGLMTGISYNQEDYNQRAPNRVVGWWGWWCSNREGGGGGF